MQMYFAVICAALWKHRGESLHLRGEQTNECKKTKPLSGGRLSLSLLLNSSTLLSIAPRFSFCSSPRVPSLCSVRDWSHVVGHPSVLLTNAFSFFVFFSRRRRPKEWVPAVASRWPWPIKTAHNWSVKRLYIKKKKQKTLDSQSAVAELHFPSGKKEIAAGFANGASGLEGLRKKTGKTLMTWSLGWKNRWMNKQYLESHETGCVPKSLRPSFPEFQDDDALCHRCWEFRLGIIQNRWEGWSRLIALSGLTLWPNFIIVIFLNWSLSSLNS